MKDAKSNQAPIGVVCTTSIMHDALRQFGHILSIAVMKRHMNYLHWPYSTPVVLDEEWHITPICEMLSLSKSFQSYDFAQMFIFYLELHIQMKVWAIFYDCSINESNLPQIVLSQEWCQLLWDNRHLDVKSWPEYFGVRSYQTHLRDHMVQMCKAVDVATFDSNFKKAKSVLAKNISHLEYWCELHDHPKQFV